MLQDPVAAIAIDSAPPSLEGLLSMLLGHLSLRILVFQIGLGLALMWLQVMAMNQTELTLSHLASATETDSALLSSEVLLLWSSAQVLELSES